jgi:hypothetical protein
LNRALIARTIGTINRQPHNHYDALADDTLLTTAKIIYRPTYSCLASVVLKSAASFKCSEVPMLVRVLRTYDLPEILMLAAATLCVVISIAYLL